jgi:hypothetical protein
MTMEASDMVAIPLWSLLRTRSASAAGDPDNGQHNFVRADSIQNAEVTCTQFELGTSRSFDPGGGRSAGVQASACGVERDSQNFTRRARSLKAELQLWHPDGVQFNFQL